MAKSFCGSLCSVSLTLYCTTQCTCVYTASWVSGTYLYKSHHGSVHCKSVILVRHRRWCAVCANWILGICRWCVQGISSAVESSQVVVQSAGAQHGIGYHDNPNPNHPTFFAGEPILRTRPPCGSMTSPATWTWPWAMPVGTSPEPEPKPEPKPEPEPGPKLASKLTPKLPPKPKPHTIGPFGVAVHVSLFSLSLSLSHTHTHTLTRTYTRTLSHCCCMSLCPPHLPFSLALLPELMCSDLVGVRSLMMTASRGAGTTVGAMQTVDASATSNGGELTKPGAAGNLTPRPSVAAARIMVIGPGTVTGTLLARIPETTRCIYTATGGAAPLETAPMTNISRQRPPVHQVTWHTSTWSWGWFTAVARGGAVPQ